MTRPSCYKVCANAIQDINEVPKYDYLVLLTDADRFTVEEKKVEAMEKIANSKVKCISCKA